MICPFCVRSVPNVYRTDFYYYYVPISIDERECSMEKTGFPELKTIEQELTKINYRREYRRTIRNTIFTLITVAAIAVLIAVLWMPVLQVYGSSMAPQLKEGDIVISHKASNFEQGDVIAFYYNNKVLVKRMIANPGDWVDIDADGNVYVNGVLLEEPYVKEKSLGDCNIDLPYQVPEGKIFVMGDHRSVSIDSRNTSVGCVADDQIVGKLAVKVWPIKSIGVIK